ncbi:response regulator [Candidatus Saccharibacteria bacterium]|nr:MAG: response regulator [Candidatus Saccharibacteria bacterium]
MLVRKKITIIEDNKPIAEMYRFKLENEGFEVDLAHTGPSGLQLVKRKKPHLVLLDLKLPHMNGDEVLERMREQDWGKDINVIIAANVSRAYAPKKLSWLDFDEYIVKAHFTPAQLLVVIRNILQQSHSEQGINT